METSLFSAAAQGFVNLLQFKIFLALLMGGSIFVFYPARQGESSARSTSCDVQRSNGEGRR